MTNKQQRFVDEYMVDMNATQAAIRAGYSEKTAYSQGQRLLKDVEIKSAIATALEEIHKGNVASAQEVAEFLTAVMRKQTVESVVVTESVKVGVTEAKVIEKPPDEKSRLSAAKILAQHHGMMASKDDGKSSAIEALIQVITGEDGDKG